MALETVGELLGRARVLLQDKVEPYRYSNADLIAGLNEACMEAKRLRPDLFLRTFGSSTLPAFTDVNDQFGDKIPHEYRPSFIYYVVGNAELQDSEENTDQRSSAMLNKFVSQLSTLPS